MPKRSQGPRAPPAPPCGRPWRFFRGYEQHGVISGRSRQLRVIPLTAHQKCPEITTRYTIPRSSLTFATPRPYAGLPRPSFVPNSTLSQHPGPSRSCLPYMCCPVLVLLGSSAIQGSSAYHGRVDVVWSWHTGRDAGPARLVLLRSSEQYALATTCLLYLYGVGHGLPPSALVVDPRRPPCASGCSPLSPSFPFSHALSTSWRRWG